jgi:ABC-2 type transport system ATP-binding protein
LIILTEPDSGLAAVLGFDAVDESLPAKDGVGLVPEFSNVYEEMMDLENLVFAAEFYGVLAQRAPKSSSEERR